MIGSFARIVGSIVKLGSCTRGRSSPARSRRGEGGRGGTASCEGKALVPQNIAHFAVIGLCEAGNRLTPPPFLRFFFSFLFLRAGGNGSWLLEMLNELSL